MAGIATEGRIRRRMRYDRVPERIAADILGGRSTIIASARGVFVYDVQHHDLVPRDEQRGGRARYLQHDGVFIVAGDFADDVRPGHHPHAHLLVFVGVDPSTPVPLRRLPHGVGLSDPAPEQGPRQLRHYRPMPCPCENALPRPSRFFHAVKHITF